MKFRFTIRDLFLLTVIAAVSIGWYVDHRGMQNKADALQAWIDKQDRAFLLMSRDNQDRVRKYQQQGPPKAQP